MSKRSLLVACLVVGPLVVGTVVGVAASAAGGHAALGAVRAGGAAALGGSSGALTAAGAPHIPGPAVIPDPGQDAPDPFILQDGAGYYLYSSEVFDRTAPVMVSYTTTFGHWPDPTPAMTTEPSWATAGFTWAPDVRRIGNRYVMYFDALALPSMYQDGNATGLGAQAQCIGTATSGAPGGPFVPASQPLVCQLDHHGSIDPRSLADDSGQLWLIWKSDDNADFAVAPSARTHIFSQRLAPDGLTLTGPRTQLLQADQAWQHGIVESPTLVHSDGWWLFYSGGWFNQPYYAVGVARCAGPAGPCTDLGRNPILSSNLQGQGPGEESLVRTSNGSWWMAYSPWAWGPSGVTNRPVALARIDFGLAGPEFETAAHASAAIGDSARS